MKSKISFFRSGVIFRAVVALVAVSAGAGCSSLQPITAADQENRWAQTMPIPSWVAPGEALATAERDAGRDPACFALIGAGRSMEPLYASGTAIVVREQSFRMLRAGQAVVYRNQSGRFVAHVLVREMEKGWLVAGLNNAEADTERVTAKNFVGVVTAAYASNPVSTPTELAVRQAIRTGVESSARTAALP